MPVEQLIYTDRPRGGGLDPSSAGYQIKARSSGLDASTCEVLASICMHYGDSVYRFAPRSAIDRETEWRAQTESLSNMPASVLNEFPTIWSYDRLADERFALTRVRYIGITHDGRFGNFLAHSLVFDPAEIAAAGAAPLALSRGDLFKDSDATAGTTLPTLPDLGKPRGVEANLGLLQGKPVAGLVHALCTASPSARPMLIALPDVKQAPAFVETLLSLLPPASRCRTTFCTYESDQTWVPTTKHGRPAGLVAAHQLLVLGGPDPRSLHLRPDEVQSTFQVFNFIANQFSPLGEARPYAAFVADCVLKRQMPRLQALHDVIERLGLGHDPGSWDVLVQTAALSSDQADPKEIAVAAQALAGVAQQPAQATVALELLTPSLQNLARNDNTAAVGMVAPPLAALANRLPAAGGPYLNEVRALASQAFQQGRACTAAAILSAAGQGRDRLLHALLPDLITKSPPGKPADLKKRAELLVEGVALVDRQPPVGVTLAGLLGRTFEAAAEVGQAAETWKGPVGAVVKARLDGAWNKEKQDMARELLKSLTADVCPDGNAWINLKVLENSGLKGDELLQRLEECVRGCARCGDAARLVDAVLAFTRKQIHPDQEKEQFAQALGRMAEAAHDSPAGAEVMKHYQTAMKALKDNARRSVRQRLARADCRRILCDEMLSELLPWDHQESGQVFEEWRSNYLEQNPAFAEGIRQELAEYIQQGGEAIHDVLQVAEQMLTRTGTRGGTPSPGCVQLTAAVVKRLQLLPLNKSWSQALHCPPDALPQDAAQRLRVMKFLTEVHRLAGEPTWSMAAFPHQNPAWSRDVSTLTPEDKKRVLSWCARRFDRCGVATTDDAQGLTHILRAAGEEEPGNVALFAAEMVQAADPVSQVVALTAFARPALEGQESPKYWGNIVGKLLDRCAEPTPKLFTAHLLYRFRGKDDKANDRLQQLCEAAGLQGVVPTAQPAPAARPADGGALQSARRFFSSLWGRSGESDDKNTRKQ